MRRILLCALLVFTVFALINIDAEAKRWNDRYESSYSPRTGDRICGDCRGSGQCSWCDGWGYIDGDEPCGHCDTSGECQRCDGKGYY